MKRPRPAGIRAAAWLAVTGMGLLGGAQSAETAETTQGDEPATTSDQTMATSQSAFRAVVVGQGTVSTDLGEAFPFVDRTGNTLYFSVVVDDDWGHQYLAAARGREQSWGELHPLPFSNDRRYSDRAPRLSPDGLRMIFTSNRPTPGREHDPRDFNLWVVDRSSPTAAWSQARALSDAVNTTSSEIHASITADGTLFFASARPGGQGRSDIYRAPRSGDGYATAVNIGAPINTEHSQPDLFVTADGSMMILVVTDYPTGLGGDDLYVSHWRNGSWTGPRNLGPAVNTPEYEYGPALSPDGRFLYFTSHRTGSGDTYRILMAELDLEP